MKNESENMDDITLLSMKQVMECLNISQWVYYRLIRSGELPTVYLGKRRMVRLKTLKEYLEGAESAKGAYGGGV